MSNSPFDIFRRNLKPLMVCLTGLALFAFVVLPMLDTYMRRNAGTIGEEVVATFDGTQLSRNRVEYFTRNHQSTVRFLVELAEETIRRGGVPQTAGFSYDDQAKRVNSIGINEVPSFQGSVRTLMLTNQAQKDGFELDDNTLAVWLQEYTAGMISDGDINAMLMRSTQNQMGRPHLYEQLRSHLLARVYEERGLSGMFLGQSPMSGPLMTPEEQWSNFLKLNRSAVASAYGVLVNDYLPKTNASPSESEIKSVYEEGKDRDPNDQSAEPAFHRRYAAKIEYVAGDFQTFLDAEVAKLSEEDIRAEYEKRLQGGEFQLPQTTPPAAATPAEAAAPAESTEPAAPAESTEPAAPAESTEPAAPAESTEPAAPAESTEPAAPAESTEPAAPAESTEPAAPAESTEPAAAEEAPIAPPETAPDQSRNRVDSAVRLVSAQQEASQDESTPPAEPASTDEAVDAAAQTGDAPAPVGDAPAPAGDAPAPAGDAPAGDAAAPAVDASGSDSPPGSEGVAESAAAPKVESFEDVRKEIAEAMVADIARQKMDAAMSDIVNRMHRYFSENTIYQTNLSIGQVGANSSPPKKPDLAQIAKELGLQHEVIGPYTQVSILDEPIARSMELGSQFLGQSASFVQMMYATSGEQSDSPTQPLFAPVRTADGPAGKQYVAWKIEETPAYTPSLDEVRDEVVLAIRMKEARKLAREAAEEIAKQAAESSDKSLRDFVPEDKLDNFKEALGPFSWMNSFGFAGATIGNVPELDSVGDEFMKAVFEGEPGKPAVAENQSGRVVYVVEPDTFEPGMDELRRQFKQPTNRMMAMLLGNGAAPIINEFFEDLDEKAKFKDLTATREP